jgi:hypothetical protein
MTALVPVLVALFNALAALGPKALDLIAQVRADPGLDPGAAKMLDGLQRGHEAHVKYLDEREPLKPNAVPDPKPTRPE